MSKTYYVYMLTNKTRSTLYTGMTGNLQQRVDQHKNKDIEGFSKRYNLRHLVYYEEHDSPLDAIRREKRIKEWKRIWKDELVESINPTWRDLSED